MRSPLLTYFVATPLACILLFAMGQGASAVPLTLTAGAPRTVGPQSASNPCIIAATTSPQLAGLDYNNFTATGGISSYNMYSTTPTANVTDGVQDTPYTVGQIDNCVGPTNISNISSNGDGYTD